MEKVVSSAVASKPERLMYQGVGSKILFVVFASTFGLATVDYIMLQVLPNYPFYLPYDWSFAHSQSLSLQLFGVLSLVAYAVWSCGRNRGLIAGIGQTFFTYGLLLSLIAYRETTLPWMFVSNGGGYPWTNEQVAYNTCFMQGPNYIFSNGSDCAFLNYGQLFWISASLSALGLVLWRYYRSGTQARRSEIKSIAVSLSGGTQT